MTDGYVLDASAVLSLINSEPGAERVASSIARSVVSAVNPSEVVAKLMERGGELETVISTLETLTTCRRVRCRSGRAGGATRVATRPFGLSFGDRACLALAQLRQAAVMTADRSWAQLRIGVTIEASR